MMSKLYLLREGNTSSKAMKNFIAFDDVFEER
jgi:hypothetical protein